MAAIFSLLAVAATLRVRAAYTYRQTASLDQDFVFGLDLFSDSPGSWADASGQLAVQQLQTRMAARDAAIVPSWFQWTINSTTIQADPQKTITDDDIRAAASRAKSSGLRVILKPHVDCESGTWRAHIGDDFTHYWQWDQWFESYTKFITRYAAIAAEIGADWLVVGTEMGGTTTRQPGMWRDVIAAIRKTLAGQPGGSSVKLVYGANFNEPWEVTFWDALDAIGVDAYFSLDANPDPPVSALAKAWAPITANLSALSAKWGKKIIFCEIGYRSYSLTARYPGVYKGRSPPDMQAQVNAYTALFQAVVGLAAPGSPLALPYGPPSWMGGVLVWSWGSGLLEGGLCDDGYTVRDKPAQDTLRSYFGQLAALQGYKGSSSAAEAGWLMESAVQAHSISSGNGTVVAYSNGLPKGWESWSYNGDFNPYNKTAALPPGRSEVFSAQDVKPYGGVSLHGNPYVPASSIDAVHLTIKADMLAEGGESANDMSIALCACDSCNTEGCGFGAVPLRRYLQKYNCSVPTDWSSQYPQGRAAVGSGVLPAASISVPMADMAPLILQDGKAVVNTSWSLHRIHIGNVNGSHNATYLLGDVWFETH